MFTRDITAALTKWKQSIPHKPLVIRGARQVGKTTLIESFAQSFDQFLNFNLELPNDRKPFEVFTTLKQLIEALFFLKGKSYDPSLSSLIFIDEIQELPEALNILRYFLEDAPEIHVIAAGSLLETIFSEKISFPVGRVEYLVVRPASFPEFLFALGEKSAAEQLSQIPLKAFAKDKLMELFHTYSITGGMPEVVQHYAKHKSLSAITPIYESLITGYIEDVEKYASGKSEIQSIRHVIRASFLEAGNRIKFQNFGKSGYGSREMGAALRTLEKALLISLVYPCTSSVLPVVPETGKSPRLQLLDTGMVNYFLGIQKEIIGTKDLNAIYGGRMIEHLIGQELLAVQYNSLSHLQFWIREKTTSMAEVDYLHVWDGKLIPVEVKGGVQGRLKSLHLFMETAPHSMAVRFWAGDLRMDTVETASHKTYYLLSLPYFLATQLNNYLPWFRDQIEEMKK